MSGVLEKHELDVLPRMELETMHAYWRAANYLAVGQIYLYDNPLLKKVCSRATVILNGQRLDPTPSARPERFFQPALVPRQPCRIAAHRRKVIAAALMPRIDPGVALGL